ncbi:MAG: translocation/assembly module TamB domain-containing protein, partial [Gemmatimonadota bacterium]
ADGGGGDIHATARIAGDSAAIDGTVTQDGRPDLRLEGSVPLGTGSAAALDLRAQADSFRVNLLTPVLDPDLVRGLAGTLDGDVRITGTAADPQLDGSLTLAGGRAHLTALGVTYRLDGRADLSGNAAHLADLRIGSGGGDLRLNGDVALESATVGTWDLAMRMDGFRAVDNDFVRATVSGDLKVNGTLTRPNVTGNVSVERGDLYLGSGLAAANVQDVTLTEADYAELEDYFGFPVRRNPQSTAPGFEALALDLSIELGRDSWLRQGANPELAVQLTGQLNVRKDPGPDLQLIGELDAIPERSYVQQFGRRFQLSQGQLVFRGDPLNTQLDLQARYEVPSRSDNQPEATITLGLQGQVGDLRVTLGSEPAMDNSDIVSYIATGRPASQSLSTGGGQGEGVAARAGGLALGQAASLIESFAAERVGLDVVEIRRQGLESATLIAGRYVSPSLYVGFQQPLGSSQGGTDSGTSEQTRVEIELQAWRWLLLNFQSGGEALQFFLKARHGY